jgi:hypothetical protein
VIRGWSPPAEDTRDGDQQTRSRWTRWDVPVEDVAVGLPHPIRLNPPDDVYFPEFNTVPSGAVAVKVPTSYTQSPLSCTARTSTRSRCHRFRRVCPRLCDGLSALDRWSFRDEPFGVFRVDHRHRFSVPSEERLFESPVSLRYRFTNSDPSRLLSVDRSRRRTRGAYCHGEPWRSSSLLAAP